MFSSKLVGNLSLSLSQRKSCLGTRLLEFAFCGKGAETLVGRNTWGRKGVFWHENGLKKMKVMSKDSELVSSEFWNNECQKVFSLEKSVQ
ncbi:hypothetical protein OAE39_01175 [Akkermansiaceae bacterium]|nr:hypothetical protein [Akkermansiaceae bacterium]